MNSTENKKKRYKPAERVSLTTTSVELLDKLLSQIQLTLPELKLSKSDLVNWLLKTRGETFTDREMAAIQRDHFDPVKALEAAIAEAKKQQVNGEEIDLHALLDENFLRKKPRPTKCKVADLNDVAKKDSDNRPRPKN